MREFIATNSSKFLVWECWYLDDSDHPICVLWVSSVQLLVCVAAKNVKTAPVMAIFKKTMKSWLRWDYITIVYKGQKNWWKMIRKYILICIFAKYNEQLLTKKQTKYFSTIICSTWAVMESCYHTYGQPTTLWRKEVDSAV